MAQKTIFTPHTMTYCFIAPPSPQYAVIIAALTSWTVRSYRRRGVRYGKRKLIRNVTAFTRKCIYTNQIHTQQSSNLHSSYVRFRSVYSSARLHCVCSHGNRFRQYKKKKRNVNVNVNIVMQNMTIPQTLVGWYGMVDFQANVGPKYSKYSELPPFGGRNIATNEYCLINMTNTISANMNLIGGIVNQFHHRRDPC